MLPMARHTTYRIGGPARAFVEVNSIAALGAILQRFAPMKTLSGL